MKFEDGIKTKPSMSEVLYLSLALNWVRILVTLVLCMHVLPTGAQVVGEVTAGWLGKT